VVYGEVKNDKVAALQDLNRREVFNLGTLAAVVLLFGLWPAPLVNVMHTSVAHLVAQIGVCKLPAAQAGDCLPGRPAAVPAPVASLAR